MTMWLSHVELQDLFGEMQNSANLQDLNDPVRLNKNASIAPVLEQNLSVELAGA